MNTALKHWKEAATVILVAGSRHKLPDSLSRCVDKSPSVQPTDGLSDLPHRSAFDYDVLMLKRSGKSGFMPNAYVFPGGLADSSDFSSDWLDLFKPFRFSPNFGLGTVKQPPETRPPMFATDRMKLGSPIPGDVAFRICAVRETFEESGVLLVVPQKEESLLIESILDKGSGGQTSLTRLHQVCEDTELARWRALVNQNPGNFIRMCRELECLPNIWALHEWGNWLTPKATYGKRYDTAFFICCLQETPPTIQDQKEIVHFKWSTPSEILHSYQTREIWVAPPQFYDLSRMCQHPSLSELHRFASQRGSEGCEQWLPVRLVTDNSYISLLPGDLLYPEEDTDPAEVNTEGPEEQQCSALHRIIWTDLYTAALQVTITPKYNHLLPIQSSSLRRRTSSQL